jgi:hypothetical protein
MRSGFRPLQPGGLATGVVWFLGFFVLAQLSRPFQRAIPRGCRTVGELAKVVLARNYIKIAKEVGGSSAVEISMVVRQLIAVEIGDKVENISDETPFPEGLNIH